MSFKKVFCYTATLAALFTTQALAAQDAVVTGSRAAVHESPSEESPILEYADPGDKIRISNHHKDGFYKVKTRGAGYGWIWQAHVAVDQDNPNLKVANLELTNLKHEHRFEKSKKRIFMRGSGFFFALKSSDISNRVDYKGPLAFYSNFGGFFDLGFGISDSMRILARTGYYQGGKTITKDNLNYQIAHSAIPVLLGLEGDVYQAKRFDISSAVYVGLGMASTLHVTATSALAPNSFTLQSSALMAVGNFSARYALGTSFSLFSELGVIYAQTSLQKISVDFNGSEIFKNTDDAQLAKFRIRQVGPYISLGVQIAF